MLRSVYFFTCQRLKRAAIEPINMLVGTDAIKPTNAKSPATFWDMLLLCMITSNVNP